MKFSHDDGIVDVAITSGPRPGRGRGRPTAASASRRASSTGSGTRFFRASNAVTNEIAGTGLGVRIMQTIVDRHAGAVVIDSEEGVGTTVTVRLPVQAGRRSSPVVTPPAVLSLVENEPQPEPAP